MLRLYQSTKILVKSPLVRGFATPRLPPAPPVWTVPRNIQLESEIDQLRSSVLAVQCQYTHQSWTEHFRIRMGYTSNKLEGSSFSEAEVMQFVKTGLTVPGKQLRDHAEIVAHDRAIRFMLDSVQAPIANVATVDFVQELHSICMPTPRAGSDDPIPGKLKTTRNMIACTPPSEVVPVYRLFAFPEDCRDQLFELLKWCEVSEKENVHILPFITLLHYNFVRIHPFDDTNGRTCRLLTALFMLRRNYPPMIIEPEDRKEYMNALTFADFQQDLNSLQQFFAKSIGKTYNELVEFGKV